MDTQLFAPLQSFLVAGPERLAAEIVLGAIALILLSIYVRGPIGTLFRVAVFIGAMAVIIGGTAILMNNVSLAGPPNPAVRLHRFLTMDWAATSDKGDGAAACADPAELAGRQPADAEHHERRHLRRTAAHMDPAPAATPAAVAGRAGWQSGAARLSRAGAEFVSRHPARAPDAGRRLHGQWIAGMGDRELGPGQALPSMRCTIRAC